MNETTRILIIEDLPTDAELVEREVRRTLPDSEFMCIETEKDFLAALESFRPDIILSDYTLPKFSGMAALKLAKEHVPEIPFILVTGSINEETAVECIKAGAWDYLIKEHITRIGPAILNTMEQKRLHDETLRSESALKKSQVIMNAALSSMTDSLFISDVDGQLVESNEAFATFHKFKSLSDCLKKIDDYPAFLEMFTNRGKSVPLDMRPVHRALRGETVTNIEYTLRRKDTGKTWEGSYSFNPIRDEQGVITGSIVVARDITEHKKAEAERERLMTAIDQADETVVITNKEGVILYTNPIFEQTTGYSCEEAKGKNPRILKSDQQDDAFYHNLWQTLTNGETWRGRLINKRKNETLYTEEATISPVLDPAGNIVNYVAVKRDITDQIELKSQLQQAQKMDSIGQLAGGVAHDFNNKLQVILGYTEMALGQTGLSDGLHEPLIEIQKAARHSSDLTRQLLAFARKQTIFPEILDLNATVKEMLNMLRRLIGEHIDLLWEPGVDLWPVKMDPSQIDQILANLSVNARDAIEGIGKVTLLTRNITIDQAGSPSQPDCIPGDYVQLSFSDNGCGMKKEVLEKVFEPFFTTKEVGKGTGLGLATLYGIVKQNNGLTTVYSTQKHGTTFKIYLPRCSDEEVAAEEAAEKKPTERGHETILLVEDETVLLNLGQQMLEALGYTVLPANLPEEALRIAEKYSGKIDLLLTDVILPEMNGQDLAAQLKKTLPKLKCIFMSGYTADVIARNNVLGEGVHFIQKPFSIPELAAKVREVLNG